MPNENDKDILAILSGIPVFNGLDDNELREIVPLLEPQVYPPDVQIIEEGSSGDSMFIIKKGTVNVSKSENSNEKVNLGNIYSGSYFGELSLIDNLPRSASIKSVDETEIFCLSKSNFDKLLSANFKIANVFYKNCLNETFSRFRNIISNFTFSQHILREKTEKLSEIDKDLSSAKEVQDFFLNTGDRGADNIFKGIKFTNYYKPCIAIGGDFFNITKLDSDKISIIIADLEGHGITAALGTGVLKSAFSIVLEKLGEKPVELLEFLNRHFYQVINQLYATCYYAVFDEENKKITLAKAGHHHPVFWKKRLNDFQEVECGGVGLGIVPEGRFHQVEFTYEEGDKMLFYTDGIIEQMNKKNEMYSKMRLNFMFRELIQSGEKDILGKLVKDMENFSDGTQPEDDVTLLLFEF
jgi:serine phosphatase RsbU (regulator of sigma subunit)